MIRGFPLSFLPFIRPSITSFTRLSPLKMCPSHRFFFSNIVLKARHKLKKALSEYTVTFNFYFVILVKINLQIWNGNDTGEKELLYFYLNILLILIMVKLVDESSGINNINKC